MKLTWTSYEIHTYIYISNCLRQTRHRALPRVCVSSCTGCVCILMCRVDASMHRFIDAFVDQSIHQCVDSSIHRCIEDARRASCFESSSVCFLLDLQYLSLISALILVSFCQFRPHFDVILVSLEVFWRPWALQGTPEWGRVEKVTENVVRVSTPGPSSGIHFCFYQRILKVRRCVGVGMHF
jgi:hypothetical protein